MTVDVVIPAYNYAAFVKKAIISAANQTYRPERIIVVNDGSTDDTERIVLELKDTLPVPLIYIKKDNGGLASARNAGIRASKSEYIAFLDADDVWKPDKLQKQMQVFTHSPCNNLGAVYCDIDDIDMAGQVLDCYPSFKLDSMIKGYVFEQMQINNMVSGSSSSIVLKKECFEEVGLFDESLPTCEDWDMWMRIAQFYQYDFVHEKLAQIRRHSSSMSRNYYRMIQGRLLIWNKMFEQGWIDDRILQEICDEPKNSGDDYVWEIYRQLKPELYDKAVEFRKRAPASTMVWKDQTPLVTVLMPVYNGNLYLHAAIGSILGQSLADFELLIMDDGSTDDSLSIIQSFQDSRIRLFRHDEKLGLVSALNAGIENSRGSYIARMDSDDISLPDRLSKQVSFMESNPQIGVCGSWVRTIGERPGEVWHYLSDPDEIKCGLLFQNHLAHPSVIIRRSVLTDTGLRYDTAYKHVEDYGLWAVLAAKTLLANIPEVHVEYRIHGNQASTIYIAEQMTNVTMIQQNQLRVLGIEPTSEELQLHSQLGLGRFQGNLAYINKISEWFLKLKAANDFCGYYHRECFTRMLCCYWDSICRALAG